MVFKELQPAIRQFEYRQGKGGSALRILPWAIFNLDTKNYTLYIESDCGTIPTAGYPHRISRALFI